MVALAIGEDRFADEAGRRFEDFLRRVRDQDSADRPAGDNSKPSRGLRSNP